MAVAGETAAIPETAVLHGRELAKAEYYILNRTARLDNNSRKKQSPDRKIFWRNIRVRPLDATYLFRLQ